MHKAINKQDDVLDHLHALMSQFKAHMFQGLRASGEAAGIDAISLMETRALGFFSHHPGSTSTDLVEHSRRDKAQIARLVKSLLERGLIEGTQDENDGRVMRYAATNEGRSIQKMVQQHRKKFGDRLVAGLSSTEREQLNGLLANVRSQLEK